MLCRRAEGVPAHPGVAQDPGNLLTRVTGSPGNRKRQCAARRASVAEVMSPALPPDVQYELRGSVHHATFSIPFGVPATPGFADPPTTRISSASEAQRIVRSMMSGYIPVRSVTGLFPPITNGPRVSCPVRAIHERRRQPFDWYPIETCVAVGSIDSIHSDPNRRAPPLAACTARRR